MADEEARGPGRPRSERARQAVLAAALALAAEEGPAGLTMEAIAKRAGVSKETLYRWWHSKIEVVIDAMIERGQTVPAPDTGTLAGDLRAFLHATADSLDLGTDRLLHSVAAAAAADEDTAVAVRDHFLAARRAALDQLLRRGAERGEIDPGRTGLALDFVYGSLWYRLIFRVGPVDHQWAEDVAAAIAAM